MGCFRLKAHCLILTSKHQPTERKDWPARVPEHRTAPHLKRERSLKPEEAEKNTRFPRNPERNLNIELEAGVLPRRLDSSFIFPVSRSGACEESSFPFLPTSWTHRLENEQCYIRCRESWAWSFFLSHIHPIHPPPLPYISLFA